MSQWLRFVKDNEIGFGQLIDDVVHVYTGDLFDNPKLTGNRFNLEEIELLIPVEAKNFLGLWNNFYSRAEEQGWEIPPEPLYFSKLVSSYSAANKVIVRPTNYDGPVYFEAELGIVVGKVTNQVSEAQAKDHIFGYTCVNDVTALEILLRDKSFPQWVRSKGFDTFCPFGPVITTDVNLDDVIIRAVLDQEIKQEYRVNDMVFPPYKLLSLLSHYMTLLPGDIIACDTASGSGPMLNGQTIEINIEGVGRLSNKMLG